LRGGFRGGFSQAGGGRDFSNQELYADYSGPDQPAAPGGGGGGGGGGGLRMDNYGGSGFSGGAYGANYVEPDPSQQIMVRNVGLFLCCYFLVSVIECVLASMVHRQRGLGRTL